MANVSTAVGAYFFAFAWGIVILLSFVGWGSGLNWLLFPIEETDWGQKAAWGLALSVVVGGILNLLSCISRTTVLIYLGSGAALWVIDTLIRRPSTFKGICQRLLGIRRYGALLVVGALVVAALSLIRYAASVSVVRVDKPIGPAGLNRFGPDDFEGYIVFPEKMLQLGSMGRDPFSVHRLESSLGGQSFLDTFALSTLSAKHLRMIDSGLGLLLIVGLMCGQFKETRAPPIWSFSILFCFLWMGPWNNTSSQYTGAALFLSLCRTLDWKVLPESCFLSRVFTIALTGSAICALKSSFIPALGAMLALSSLCYLASRQFKWNAALEVVCTALLLVIFTLPWMISMYQSSGTLLYPLLGKGYHQSVFRDSFSPYRELIGVKPLSFSLTDACFVALSSLGVFYIATRQRGIRGREAVLCILLGALSGKFVITFALQGIYSERYSFPYVLAAILVLMTEVSSNRPEAPVRKRWEAAALPVVAAVATFLVGSSWNDSRVLYPDCLRTIQMGLTDVPLVSSDEVEAYRSLQRSVPPDEAILVRLEKPFLFDFKRNTAFVVYYVESSPPPGMPLFRGSEPLARYLVSQSIRYVAYSYKQFDQSLPSLAKQRYLPAWWRAESLQTQDFQDNLQQLGKTRTRIYDDGKNFVLDLLQPSVAPSNQR